MLFEVLDAGPVAIDAKGVKLAATIEPTFGALRLAPTARVQTATTWRRAFIRWCWTRSATPSACRRDARNPRRRGRGSGSGPGARRDFVRRRRLERDGSYLIIANVAPVLLVGPRIVALPANLEKAPLPLWQGADETISIPLRSPKNGRIVAHDGRGGDVALTLEPRRR